MADGRRLYSEELDRRFNYHPPTPSDVEVYGEIRRYARSLVDYIVNNTAPCEEQRTAIHKIEEAVMWANAGRARHGAE